MNKQFNIEIDEKDVIAQIKKLVKANVESEVNELFSKRIRYGDKGSQVLVRGTAQEYIHNTVEDLCASFLVDDVYVEAYIKNNWRRILDNAIELALQHKANALAFNAIKSYIPKK